MKKTMFLLTIIALGHACQTSSKLAIETYNEIKNENKLIEEFIK